MSHHEQESPERQAEEEDKQYLRHGHPNEERERVGLPPEEEKRAPNERD